MSEEVKLEPNYVKRSVMLEIWISGSQNPTLTNFGGDEWSKNEGIKLGEFKKETTASSVRFRNDPFAQTPPNSKLIKLHKADK